MGAVAIIFPGQGSQRVGMARDFHERFPVARDAFNEASESLGFDVAALCFEADPRLDLTEFTQPAILTAEVAMFRALRDAFGLSAAVFGGHSLGEYSALCAAGVIGVGAAAKLVRKRGALMQAAVPAGQGAMVAAAGEGIAALDLAAPLDSLGIDVANLNSPNQVVLSGPAAAMEKGCACVRSAAGDRPVDFTPLSVSAPFHSRAMRVIEAEFRAELEALAPSLEAAPSARVTSNFRGGFHAGDGPTLVDALVRQISAPVDWVANMRAIGAAADRVLEVGPNRPLRGFFRAIGVEVTSILSVKAAEATLGAG
jgi:malonyl CoA-acyl carrier protein transacylase